MLDEAIILASGTFKSGKKLSGESLAALNTHLEDLLSRYSPVLVGYEQIRQEHRSRAAARAFGAYEGFLLKVCHEFGLTCVGYGVQKVKKFATGSSSADKLDMECACNKLFGRWPDDDNEADALMIAALLRDEFRYLKSDAT